ncbi:serine hydrolase-like protein [Megalopta genalis]|uniref:serine hydrolase-like protein n=1 Tax=Megalopta genalis TaxID=115081 RepID=UPI003FD3DBDF
MSQLKKQFAEVKFPVPWGHVAAKVYGSPKEKKILVVHGILDNAGSFDRLIELLPQEYQYVSIDLPGHGFSSPFPSGLPLKFFDYVHTILLVLNTLKWRTCIYLAHSFGAHIGTYFSVLYPGRLERIIAIDGFVSDAIDDIVSRVQDIYNLNAYSNVGHKLYTKEEVIYALQYKRKDVLNTEAAEAMFTRAVTKVGDLYKYNRDPRLRIIVRPMLNIQMHAEFWKKFRTPSLLIVANSSSTRDLVNKYAKQIESVTKDKSIFDIVSVEGTHDVHNNYPERVAPHVYKILKNDTKSKL